MNEPQSLGSLARKISESALISDSPPTTAGSSPTNAGTGVRKNGNALAPRASATGSVRTLRVNLSMLEGADYTTVESLLRAWWPLVYVTPPDTPTTRDGRTVYIRYPSRWELAPGRTTADVAAMRHVLKIATAPAPKPLIARELVRLSVLTTARAPDQADLTIEVYADEISGYPADVVVHVLRVWPATEKWWPAWAELKARLDKAVEWRESLRDDLERFGDNAQPKI